MINEIWLFITGTITTFVGAFVSFIFTKSKYKTEVDANKIQNFSSSIDAYKTMYEDMIEDLKDNNKELREELASVKKELHQTREQLLTLTNLFLVSAMKGSSEQIDSNSLNKLMDIIKYGTENKE